MEAIKDFFGSLMLRELFKGLALTGRYMFARKITGNFQKKKRRSHRVFVDCTPCVAIPMAKNAALPANCAKRFALPWRSASSPSSAMMVHAAPRATTSI